MKEERLELHRYLSQSRQKFVYYLIALCVAAIGFSVHQTSGDILRLTHIPLGIAIVLWGISVYTGLRSLEWVMATVKANAKYLEVQEGVSPESGNHPEKVQIILSELMRIMKVNVSKEGKLGLFQKYSFYFGVVFFLIWHVIEMYTISLP